jgi:hypothetical protein
MWSIEVLIMVIHVIFLTNSHFIDLTLVSKFNDIGESESEPILLLNDERMSYSNDGWMF